MLDGEGTKSWILPSPLTAQCRLGAEDSKGGREVGWGSVSAQTKKRAGLGSLLAAATPVPSPAAVTTFEKWLCGSLCPETVSVSLPVESGLIL